MNILKSICGKWVRGMAHDVQFIFEDNTVEIKKIASDAIEAALLEAAAEIVSQTARNTRVKTGKTKGSWAADVRQTSDGYKATIGSPEENAIWEEFGTGDYALNGDGRKGGWAYEDPKTGEEIWTHGKKPSRAFLKAFTTTKPKIIKQFQDKFGSVFK